MKRRISLIIMVAMLLLQQHLLYAQSSRIKKFVMTVKGTSTMHDWESSVEKMECNALYKIEDDNLVAIRDAVIRIPVKSIRSTKGKMMDNKTWEAFQYSKFPSVFFTLTSETIDPVTRIAELAGNLTMAGTTKKIALSVNYKVLPNGELQITGSKKIKMTDFKMEPPTAMLGSIEVGDEVTITFDLVLSISNTIL